MAEVLPRAQPRIGIDSREGIHRHRGLEAGCGEAIAEIESGVAEHERFNPHSIRGLAVGVGMPNLAATLISLVGQGHSIELPVEMESLLAAVPVLEQLRVRRSAEVPRGVGLPLMSPPAGGDPSRLTVVLDLDETLVHCRLDELDSPSPDFCVQFEDTDVVGFVYLRPSVMLFIEVAARLFEIVVFTASSQNYADQVLNRLDPQQQKIAKRLYRQHCQDTNGTFFKDLRELGRPLDRAVLVDNSPVSLMLCPDNGVLVSSWTAEQVGDRELLDLLLLLQECAERPSVQGFLAERYGLAAFQQELFRRPESFFVPP